jgi:hypothetical protein
MFSNFSICVRQRSGLTKVSNMKNKNNFCGQETNLFQHTDMHSRFRIFRVPSQSGPLAAQRIGQRNDHPLPSRVHPCRKDLCLDLMPHIRSEQLDSADPAVLPSTQHLCHLGPGDSINSSVGVDECLSDKAGKNVSRVGLTDVLGDRVQEVE